MQRNDALHASDCVTLLDRGLDSRCAAVSAGDRCQIVGNTFPVERCDSSVVTVGNDLIDRSGVRCQCSLVYLVSSTLVEIPSGQETLCTDRYRAQMGPVRDFAWPFTLGMTATELHQVDCAAVSPLRLPHQACDAPRDARLATVCFWVRMGAKWHDPSRQPYIAGSSGRLPSADWVCEWWYFLKTCRSAYAADGRWRFKVG
jgi:hypothetical protein